MKNAETQSHEGPAPSTKFTELPMKWMRLFIYLLREMVRDNCFEKASALAFATILSLLPLFIVSFSLFKSFGGGERFKDIESTVETTLVNYLRPKSRDVVKRLMEGDWDVLTQGEDGDKSQPGRSEDSETKRAAKTDDQEASKLAERHAADVAKSYSEIIAEEIGKLFREVKTGTTLNVVSFIFLIVLAVMLMNTIESALNDIWKVIRRRSYWGRFTAFWAIITLGPVLITCSILLTTWIGDKLERFGLLKIPIAIFVLVLPIFVTWLAFFLGYALLPNTKVRLRSALAGALVGGVMWEFAKLGFDLYVSTVPTYSKLYGSLGAIPVFLGWVYITWLIILFGAEFAYTSQNLGHIYRRDSSGRKAKTVSEYLALRIVLSISKRFWEGKGPATNEALATELGATDDVVASATQQLAEGGVLSTVNGDSDSGCQSYLPAKAPETLTVRDVIHSIRRASSSALAPASDGASRRLEALFHPSGPDVEFDETAMYNLTFKELIAQG